MGYALAYPIRNLAICACCFIAAANAALFILGRARRRHGFHGLGKLVCSRLEMLQVGSCSRWQRSRSLAQCVAWIPQILLVPVLWFGACFLFRIKPPAEGSESVTSFALMLGFGSVLSAARQYCMDSVSSAFLHAKMGASLGKISYGLYVGTYHAHGCSGLHLISAGSVPLALGFHNTLSQAFLCAN